MSNFRVFTHLDTFPVIVRLGKAKLEIPQDGILSLRDGDHESATFKEWKSLHILLTKARKAIGSPEEIGDVAIVRMLPGQVTNWDADETTDFLSFCIPLVANPNCRHYAREEMVHMPVGSLWWFNTEVTNSAANWGVDTAYNLIFDLRKPGASDDGDSV